VSQYWVDIGARFFFKGDIGARLVFFFFLSEIRLFTISIVGCYSPALSLPSL